MSLQDATYTATANVQMIPVKRRNGKLQSCEPCRKRKLSCDHRLPACGRCIKRRKAPECFYHPAPLSKSSDSPSSTVLNPGASQYEPDRLIQQQDSPAALISSDTADPPRPAAAVDGRCQSILSVPSAGILMESATITYKVGFLGETSSSAVVTELNESLGIHVSEDLGSTDATGSQTVVSRRWQYDGFNTDSDALAQANIQHGVALLAFFEHIDVIDRFLEYSLSIKTDTHPTEERRRMDGFLLFCPVYRTWLEGLKSVKLELDRDASPNKLERQALTIWRSTAQPLRCTAEMSALEWALQATGKNLRFETLGLLITVVGIIAANLPRWHPFFTLHPLFEKMSLMKWALQLASTSIELCDKCGSRNDLTVCLLFNKSAMVGYVKGDTSNEMWSAFSEVCDDIILQGLHLGKSTENDPFFLKELRIRLFNVSYSVDKFLATFLGRPPHLSYKYCVVRAPHELNDAEACMKWEDIARLLDERKASGPVYGRSPTRSCWRNAWVKRHEVREDVLEIVIGTSMNNLNERIDYVLELERKGMEAMPAFARVDPDQVLDDVKRNPFHPIPGCGVPWTPLDIQCLLAVHVGHRHSKFLLERARVNKLGANSDRLVAASRSLLGLLLKRHSMSDMFAELHVDNTDALAFYATSAGGVLAMEVLKRDQLQHTDDDFPRSAILQQLSVLVAALEAQPPEEGNSAVCIMGLNAIRRVLDRLLSKPKGPATYEHRHGPSETAQFGANNDADFLQWLGSVNFDATAWLDTMPAGFYSNADLGMHAASV